MDIAIRGETLLDKMGCAVIADFQMDKYQIINVKSFTEELHTRPYMDTKRRWPEENISNGFHCTEQDHFILHFTTFQNVSI